MRKRVWLTRAFTFGMAVLSMPTLALAQAVSVKLESPGELSGTGVVVPVKVACVANSTFADIEVRLSQDSGEFPPFDQANGESNMDLAPGECRSTPQTVHVFVEPDGPPPFNAVDARATATLDACDSSFRNCNRLSNSRNINVVP
jgi:hypothetical protein